MSDLEWREIERLTSERDALMVALKGIEVYSTSHDDARAMAAKAIIRLEDERAALIPSRISAELAPH